MSEANCKCKKVVLGLGNLLMGDEGFGIHAVRYMQEKWDARFPVEWIDGGVLGLNLLPLVEECSHLLILDAIDAGKQGGSVLELRQEEIQLYHGAKMSEHQVGFQEVLALAKFRGNFPDYLHLVGVQPVSLATSTSLSDSVAAALPAAIKKGVAVLSNWFPTN